MKTKLRTFVIDRDRWARAGSGKGRSMLLNGQGNMCCLGFLSKKCGIPKSKLSTGTPASINLKNEELRTKLRGLVVQSYPCRRNTDICDTLMSVNDDMYIDDSERESKLVKLFARIGWKPRFIH